MTVKHFFLCALLTALFHTPAAAMPGGAENRFSAADTDKDGFLSRAEFAAAFPGLKSGAFALIDTDGDGRISGGEWLAFTSGHGMGQPANSGGNVPSSGQVLPSLPILQPSPEPDKAASGQSGPGAGSGPGSGGTFPLLTPPGK